MATAENQTIVLRILEEYVNQKKAAVWDELAHPDVVVHGVAAALQGVAEAKAWYTNVLFRAFPNLHMTVDDVIAAADKVVVRVTESATMTGSFMGMPPTHKSYTIAAVQICRLAEGKLVEMWGVRDTGAQMRQLGLMSPPVPPVNP